MAPEVVVDGHADPRSDIYSLGVMLFEAATGRLPFYGDSPYQLMRQHVDIEAPRARSVAPDLPAAIDEAIARALAKDPLDRFATMEDFAHALAEGAPTPPIALVSDATTTPAPARRPCPQCGGWLVEAAAACADCGAVLLRLEHLRAGGVSVLVTGPGQPGDKIDARRHVALFKLLDELPPGSLPLAHGRRRAPRVPFYVARGISERSAEALLARLHAIDLEARVEVRGAFGPREMRTKLKAMTARHTIGGGGLFVLFNQTFGLLSRLSALSIIISGSIILVLWGGAFAGVAYRYSRPLVPREWGRMAGRDPLRRLALALHRLRARQDRRLVGRILERPGAWKRSAARSSRRFCWNARRCPPMLSRTWMRRATRMPPWRATRIGRWRSCVEKK